MLEYLSSATQLALLSYYRQELCRYYDTETPEMYLNTQKVVIGFRYSFFVTATGEVYASGYNDYGQLGLGDTSNRQTFTLVPLAERVIAVATGSGHSLLLTASGEVYASGLNVDGQLGLGDIPGSPTFTFVRNIS